MAAIAAPALTSSLRNCIQEILSNQEIERTSLVVSTAFTKLQHLYQLNIKVTGIQWTLNAFLIHVLVREDMHPITRIVGILIACRVANRCLMRVRQCFSFEKALCALETFKSTGIRPSEFNHSLTTALAHINSRHFSLPTIVD